ncbi:hypothetical protein Aperf_G00000024095 [Anoplocephala perfoliata]
MSQLVAKADQLSDSEVEEASKFTDPASCLDYLKRREVFLYKMMNDPSHKAMLYFLEVLMNSEVPLTVEQLAARFSNKSFSNEMREACGGGSVDALKDFLLKYPSLFTVKPTGLVSAVAIEMPGFDEISEASIDVDHLSVKQNLQTTNSSANSVGRQEQRPTNSSPNEVSEDITTSTQTAPLKSSLKNSSNGGGSSSSNEFKPVGIYQPPILRAQAAAAAAAAQNRNSHICEMCSMAAHMATTAATTVVHCPFTDLNCLAHHHHHRGQRFNSMFKHAHTATSHCCCSNDHPSSFCRGSGGKLPSCPQIANFALETEAVKFFQQRLGRREERWVPIKSLAGHLSQASSEVRSVVGPQLEFRRFLLKHPHVFEVQGDLVGLKDSFFAPSLSSRRPKSFGGSSLNSQSSTSLSTLNLRGGGVGSFAGSQKVSRPKSLIMLSQASSTAISAPIIRRLGNLPSGSEHFLPGCDLESLAISAPNIPSGQLNRNGSISKTQRNMGSGQNSVRYNSSQPDTVNSSVRQPARKNRGQEIDTTNSSSGSICIRMSANEYRAIMFLRKVLAKKGGAPGQPGLSYLQLMQILSAKAPETVQSAIGWTKVELEEFILQHPIFFEVHESPEAKTTSGSTVTWEGVDTATQPTTVVTNRRVLRMINIVITGNKPLDSGVRTMTNRCGRVFHVAKLWGIIDLGKHEHVFFDKSILKYVDDLQKHFKVNETLYFNAILAPKESRAKWRATQVWKECDKEIMEKYTGSAFADRGSARAGGSTSNNGSASNAPNNTAAANVQKEEGGMGKVGKTSIDSDSSDYGLVDEEEVEEELGEASAIARAEGLNLANDIKFLSDDVEAELERILGPTQPPTTTTAKNPTNQVLNDVSDEDTSITGCIEDISVNFSDPGSMSEKHPSTCCVTSTTQKGKKASVAAADSPLSERLSIAVQTLSTGDIMATQIFHD